LHGKTLTHFRRSFLGLQQELLLLLLRALQTKGQALVLRVQQPLPILRLLLLLLVRHHQLAPLEAEQVPLAPQVGDFREELGGAALVLLGLAAEGADQVAVAAVLGLGGEGLVLQRQLLHLLPVAVLYIPELLLSLGFEALQLRFEDLLLPLGFVVPLG
jgi:hypothetical protein